MRHLPLLLLLACSAKPTGDSATLPTTGSAASGSPGGTAAGSTPTGGTSGTTPSLCPDPLPASWIWCDDFESTEDLALRYFEVGTDDGEFQRVELDGNPAVEVHWQPGEVDAGGLKVFFGRNPAAYGNNPHLRPTEDFTEIYWRMRVMHQAGWPDVGPAKLSRTTVFTGQDWSQAMIAHLWSGGGTELVGDPATCVTGSGVDCVGYNDFANLRWLGIMGGTTPIFSSAESGSWHCVEGHVRLNTPGLSDGVFEFWIDGVQQSARTDLDWRGSYTDHGLNAVMFENYWNDGAVSDLKRWFDDLAIATEPIGCGV